MKPCPKKGRRVASSDVQEYKIGIRGGIKWSNLAYRVANKWRERKNHPCSTMSRNMGPNMVKAAMDLNLTSNLCYLFRLMKTLLREVQNLKLEDRSNMATRDMKLLIRGVEVTNICRFMSMFIMKNFY